MDVDENIKVKDNIMFAEFLDWKEESYLSYHTPFDQDYLSVGAGICETSVFRTVDFLFNKEWNWLMALVEKIESIEEEFTYKYEVWDGGKREGDNEEQVGYFVVEIKDDKCVIRAEKYSIIDMFSKPEIMENTPKFESTYNAVKEFIEWYNGSEHVQERR